MDNLVELDGEFKVCRVVNGKEIVYGIYESKDVALAVIEDLESNGWPLPLFSFVSPSSSKESSEESIEESIEESVEESSKEVSKESVEESSYKEVSTEVSSEEPLKEEIVNLDEDRYIYKFGNEFIIIKEVDGVFKSFGVFNDFNSAVECRDKVEDSNWSSGSVCDISVDSRHIYLNGNFFRIEKSFNGVKKLFGHYRKFEEAFSKRNELIVNDWDVSKVSIFTIKSRPMRYIVSEGDKFKIRRMINGKLRSFGVYDTREEAMVARDAFESSNWRISGELSDKYLSKSNYITKTGHGFRIYKRVSGELKCFGSFDTLEDAIVVRDKLIDNDWDTGEVSIPDDDGFNENFIEFDGEYYTVERLVFGRVCVYGVFKNLNLAVLTRDELVGSSWEGGFYSVKSEEYPYGEGIVPFDYVFNVRVRLNGVFYDFGSFSSYPDAVSHFHNLRWNDWNLDEDSGFVNSFFNEVCDVFNSVSLSPSFIDTLPKSCSFDGFLNFLKVLSNTCLQKSEIISRLGISFEEFDNFVLAGKYLGLVNKLGEDFFNLSGDFDDLFSLNSWDMNLELVKLILSHRCFYLVFKKYLSDGSIPDLLEVKSILKSHGFKDSYGELVLDWVNWIVNLYTKDSSVSVPKVNDFTSSDILSFIRSYFSVFSSNLKTFSNKILSDIRECFELKEVFSSVESSLSDFNDFIVKDLELLELYSNLIFNQFLRVLDLFFDYINLNPDFIGNNQFKVYLDELDSFALVYSNLSITFKNFMSIFSKLNISDMEVYDNLNILFDGFNRFIFTYTQFEAEYSFLKSLINESY